MLTDRKWLVEHEIEKSHKLCAEMYKQMAIDGKSELADKYEAEFRRLADLKSDLTAIDAVLNEMAK